MAIFKINKLLIRINFSAGILSFFPLIVMLFCWEPADNMGLGINEPLCTITKIIYFSIQGAVILADTIIFRKGKADKHTYLKSITVFIVMCILQYFIFEIINWALLQ